MSPEGSVIFKEILGSHMEDRDSQSVKVGEAPRRFFNRRPQLIMFPVRRFSACPRFQLGVPSSTRITEMRCSRCRKLTMPCIQSRARSVRLLHIELKLGPTHRSLVLFVALTFQLISVSSMGISE